MIEALEQTGRKSRLIGQGVSEVELATSDGSVNVWNLEMIILYLITAVNMSIQLVLKIRINSAPLLNMASTLMVVRFMHGPERLLSTIKEKLCKAMDSIDILHTNNLK
ncbi:unnamed protein product [Vicia faba]|uniref:Uncharacterized protein n=1 Tax=Vicia faba TaxID=3906 RepID=A0AAV0YBI4_VICFA|nr:unnamed protein product [Vicia faba]